MTVSLLNFPISFNPNPHLSSLAENCIVGLVFMAWSRQRKRVIPAPCDDVITCLTLLWSCVRLAGELWHSDPCLEECAEVSHPTTVTSPGVVSPTDRRVVHVVGVACILGMTTSLASVPGYGAQQEMMPSEFRSRALLSISESSAIRVSPHLFR